MKPDVITLDELFATDGVYEYFGYGMFYKEVLRDAR
jgi:hypothetical protein